MTLELISREPQQLRYPRPVLFVHGAWHGAWCWDRGFLDRFARNGFSAHAVSLRGHGASAGRSRLRWNTLSDYADDVAEAASHLSAPPVLVGHSMGGATVQKLLERAAAPAAVLMASMPPSGVWRVALDILRHRPVAFARMNLRMSLMPVVETPELVRRAFFSDAMPDAQVADYAACMQDESYRAFLGMLALELPRPKRVSTPMLVIGAGQDTIFLPAQVAETARAYGTEPVMFPDMAHDMMLEPGWEAVADHIMAWLEAREASA